MPEIGYGDVDVEKDVEKVFKEIVWKISLVSESKANVKKEVEQCHNPEFSQKNKFFNVT